MTKVVIVDLESKSIKGINYNNPVSRDERQWYDGRYVKLPAILPINPKADRVMVNMGYRHRISVLNQEVWKKTPNEYKAMCRVRNNIRASIRAKGL